jgi:hypothetical protein
MQKNMRTKKGNLRNMALKILEKYKFKETLISLNLVI